MRTELPPAVDKITEQDAAHRAFLKAHDLPPGTLLCPVAPELVAQAQPLENVHLQAFLVPGKPALCNLVITETEQTRRGTR